jgi:hypothetical protein
MAFAAPRISQRALPVVRKWNVVRSVRRKDRIEVRNKFFGHTVRSLRVELHLRSFLSLRCDAMPHFTAAARKGNLKRQHFEVPAFFAA